MDSAQIRESFLSFFENKGCKRLPSSSLVPDDPSLLLTTAGMVQFKPVFLGVKEIGVGRATTVQKCVRTTDIDIIGTTGRHHSFFEMLGNFSFGDYFKSEACAWAYEYSVDVLGLDPERLWFSIFEDDDEAERIWAEEVGVPRDRIVRMGAEDNFWSAGPTGPCGPCSELYYDQGEDVGCGLATCAPGCDCDRYLEYWNLVFMQYDRTDDGTLEPLPKKSIDTGMGLERLASILQGVRSNFETDVLRAIMEVAEQVTDRGYGELERTDTSLRIIADHSRAVTFMIADGILPSNEGRGYVLRRLLRRAVRHGRLLGVETEFLEKLVGRVVELMGSAYPEIVENRELIVGVVENEEKRFGSTLRQGLRFLEDAIHAARDAGEWTFDGRIAFALHDTYGFPVELTSEIVSEAGLQVDMEAFEAEMQAQRERGRAALRDESWAVHGGVFSEVAREGGPLDFVGYEADETEARVVAIVIDGQPVDRIEAGTEAEVVLDATPFYGEQGGQVGDAGHLLADGMRFEVGRAHLPEPGVVAHSGRLVEGVLEVGERVHAAIDVMRRERIRRNHTATHLLHWALRLVLGEHVRQAGSLVAPDRLRFDYTHFEAPTREQLDKVERLINAKIMEAHPVRAYETSLRSAREAGVTALFGEKYGDFVRVLEIGNFSKELCGGTHVGGSTEIGLFKIVGESSVGANTRRIEGVTSFDALGTLNAAEAALAAAADEMRCSPSQVPDRVRALLKRVKDTEAALADAKRRGGGDEVEELLSLVSDIGYPVVVSQVEAADAEELRDLSDRLRSRLQGGAVVLASESDGKALLLAAGSDASVSKGFDAGALIKAMAPKVGGGGGGKPAMAQAGGKDPSGIAEALSAARSALGID